MGTILDVCNTLYDGAHGAVVQSRYQQGDGHYKLSTILRCLCVKGLMV